MVGTASLAAADLARSQDMERAYDAMVDQQASGADFAHINRMLQLCPLPPDGACYAAWIRYDERKKQPKNAAAANAPSQQVANRYTRRLNALRAEPTRNNCP